MQFSLHLTDVRPAQSMTLRKRHKFKVLKILQVTRMQLGFRGENATITQIYKQPNILQKLPIRTYKSRFHFETFEYYFNVFNKKSYLYIIVLFLGVRGHQGVQN